MARYLQFFFCLISTSLFPRQLPAEVGVAFFEKKIRPVLVKHCYECHSTAAANAGKLKGNLQLDTREGIRKGGDLGPAVVPGKPTVSWILKALRQEKDLEMPPKGKLPDAVIADFESWIQMGAADPRNGKMVNIVKADDFTKARQFWSLQPVAKPTLPTLKDSGWPKSDLDFFVAQKREVEGLQPASDATPQTLIRRLYFDLIGLPPTPEEFQKWEKVLKTSQDGLADLADNLLDSPHFGERWGRHWLDIARYADSNGRARNVLWHHAWRYRDWVIEAFNRDLPYNAFIKHQIAGDLFPHPAKEGYDRQCIAVGFLALGPKAVEESRKEQFINDVIDEQIDVITRGIIGMSVSCARCHDHKFDPIPTKDYYALAGIFRSTQTQYGYGPPGNWNINNDSEYRLVGKDVETLGPDAAEHRTAVIAKIRERGEARRDRYRIVRKVADVKRKLKSADEKASEPLNADLEKLEKEVKDWDERIKKMDEELLSIQDEAPPQPAYAMSARDKENMEDSRLFIRGEIATPGDYVPRGNLRFLDLPGMHPVQENESGRKQLAQWLSSDHNPLTPRVFVNRVWQQLFDLGIVTTPDDFGKTGAEPSHPELLDYLADDFVENKWSMKNLIRTIVLSRTYQMSSQSIEDNLKQDPENKWLWRMPVKRLEVEPFRDAILAVSGQLNPEPMKGSLLAEFNEFKEFEFNFKTKLAQEKMLIHHRSVYLPIVRGNLPEVLDLFDFADPESLTAMRSETTVPSQSLFLMNNEWVIEQANHLAKRLEAGSSVPEQKLRYLFQLAYSRQPSSRELDLMMGFVSGNTKAEKWGDICQAILASTEFRHIR